MTNQTVSLPQRLFAVTLGCQDVSRQRSFYESWGWRAADYSTPEYVSFNVGGMMLAFYPTPELAKEAAPDVNVIPVDGWKPVTLAVNLPSKQAVDQTWQDAVNAGATAVTEPEDRPWGGRSGYIADPEGNSWELVWLPPELLPNA